VYALDEVLADPQVNARKLLDRTTFAGSSRPVPVASPAVRLSRSPGEIRHGAPAIGQHTDEILREHGYSQDEIDAFRSAGVV
jgi:crotonobetainyl-CoA:carnitine CoA-transferase CaiB-like acyl-CoA transferase